MPSLQDAGFRKELERFTSRALPAQMQLRHTQLNPTTSAFFLSEVKTPRRLEAQSGFVEINGLNRIITGR